MRDPLLRAFSGNDSSTKSDHEESWLSRVRENLGQLLIPAHLKPTAANGAPIHLLKFDKSQRPARAQGASLITHAAAFAAVLLLLAHGPGTTSPLPRGVTPHGPVDIPMPVFRSFTSEHPSNPGGRSGDQNQIPATHGELPPRSPVVLVRPTLPQDQHPSLPEPPTIFDTTAVPAASTGKIGLRGCSRIRTLRAPEKAMASARKMATPWAITEMDRLAMARGQALTLPD
ncbi:MAG: hypothetical protein WBE24_03270 [Candidatus Acidiferrum sp.]